MQVIPKNKLPTTEFLVSVGQKGQITVPKEFRTQLKVKPFDKLILRLNNKSLSIHPAKSSIDAIYQMGKRLKKQLTVEQQTAIAWEEHAKTVIKKDK